MADKKQKPHQKKQAPQAAHAKNAQLNRKNQLITWGGAAGIIVLLGLILLGLFYHQHAHSTSSQSPSSRSSRLHMISLSDIDDLSDSATSTALSAINQRQHDETKALNVKMAAMSDQMNKLMAHMTALKKHPLATPPPSKHTPLPGGASRAVTPHPSGLAGGYPNQNVAALSGASSGAPMGGFTGRLPGVAVFHFTDQQASKTGDDQDRCDDKHCLLPGTFAQAVMIGGADANASVNGQSQTTPVLFKILKPAVLPNGHHINLKGCFVVGTVYGDISSERGEIKLTHLSCILHGHVISKQISLGTAYGIGGKEGLRGDPVMRNGKLLMYAGLSGFVSGIGSAIQQSNQTQSISPLGVTTTMNPGHVFESGAANGTSTALGKLADYYIKRADQYHPVIQLNPGSLVDVVFLSQINLKPDVTHKSTATALARASTPLSRSNNRAGMTLANAHYEAQMNQAVASQLKQSIQQHYGESQ